MFGDIDRGPAIFAADREALRHAQQHQQPWGEQADGIVVRQEADSEGGHAHDRDGHEESALAACAIADVAEHHGAERAHEKSGGESEEGEDVALDIARAGKEVLGDDGGE